MRQAQVQLKDHGLNRIGRALPIGDFGDETIRLACDRYMAEVAERLPSGTVYEIFIKELKSAEGHLYVDPPGYILWLWTSDTDQDAPLGDVVEEFNEEGLKVVHRARTPG